MKKLHRIEIGNKILEQLYNENCNMSDDRIVNLFYDFLINKGNKNDFFTQSMCFNYGLELKELEIYKQDMILEIIATSYEFLNYSKVAFEETLESDNEILNDFNTIPFSVKNLVNYFRSVSNVEKVKKIISSYFVYMAQDAEFIDDCREYNLEEITEFYDKIIRTIKYIGVADVLMLINEEVFAKYHPDAEDEEDEEEQEYDEEDEEFLENNVLTSVMEQMDEKYLGSEEEYQELHQKILTYLDDYFMQDKSLVDDFIGYFMSYVYAFLVKVYEENQLTLEDEELLSIFLKPNITFEYVVEMFHSSKEFACYSVELFSQQYYSNSGDVYSMRENYCTPSDNRKFKLLDPYYQNESDVIAIAYFETPIVKSLDFVLQEMKKRYPQNYVDKIYQLLSNAEADCSIFEEAGLNVELLSCLQLRMIRYLARKYIEECSLKQLADFSLDELFIYQGFMFASDTNNNIRSLMDKGFPHLISNYYTMCEKGTIYEKNIIRELRKRNLLEKLQLLDPGCMTDEIFLKALNETDFYAFLEWYGVEYTINYLCDLPKDSDDWYEYLKEVLFTNYYYAKQGLYDDLASNVVIRLFEKESSSLRSHCTTLLAKEQRTLLKELLQRYIDQETRTEYSLPYEEKLETSPKVKQILYPKMD